MEPALSICARTPTSGSGAAAARCVAVLVMTGFSVFKNISVLGWQWHTRERYFPILSDCLYLLPRFDCLRVKW